MNLKFKLALIIIMVFNVSLFAQGEYLLKGQVVSIKDTQPIPGVNVIIQNSTKGTTTDFDGNYEIEVKKGDVLLFSYIGFATQVVIINNQKELNISLVEDLNKLDEVVIVGYGTQKKSHLTGSISKVVNEGLDQIATARVDDALVGQVSGVNIQTTEGDAGSAPTIRIRGTGSLAGSSSPLIVVDGLAVDEDFLGSLDMNDVDSFEVLKDAASSAIYGSRGANGVIMITTKKGKEGKTKFSFNTFTGRKEARQSEAYYFSVKDEVARELADTGTLSSRAQYIQLLGIDNDWQNIIFNGGTINNFAFSARGGSERTKFSVSLGYSQDEGVLIIDDYKKYNGRISIDSKLSDKFTIGGTFSPSYTNRIRFDGSTHDILRQSPWLPLYLDEHSIQFVNRLRENGRWANAQIGDYAEQRMFDDFDLNSMMPVASGGTDISDTSNTNPAAKVLERDRRDLKFKLFGNFYAQYNITDDLTFRGSIGGDFQNTNNRRFIGEKSNNIGPSAIELTLADENVIHIVTEDYLSYNKTFGGHDVSAVAGFAAEKWDTSYKSITGAGYENEYIQTLSAATLINEKISLDYQRRLLSLFGRLNYAYEDKYLASLSFRRDGGSVFGPNNKYGNFPAASLGWVISKENFMRDSEVINNLKFRFSYGVTGNLNLDTGDDLIDNYPYMALLIASTAVVDNNLVTGFDPINIANPFLQWERSIEINPGVDFGLFNNVVSGSFEFYKRNSDQLLLNNPISATTGFTEAIVNLGEVENRGFELELRTRNVSNENFKWTSTVLASVNKNELVSFGDSNGLIQNVDDKRAAEWINLIGNPISSFYGWVVDRDIPLEYIINPYFPIGAQAQDVYVKDLNGDGLIDDDDKTILGDPYPDLIWSFTNEFEIGNVDVSFMFQGSHGAEVRNMGDQYLFNHFNSSQDFNTATTPNQGFIREKIFTNDIIQDASYISLRNVNIGYSFSKDFANKLGLSKARFYAAGQNLLYFTADNYTGFNPESIDNTSPTTYGYQRAGSPIYRTISLGLNIEF
ncbi:SusC/RagA family TonB-linked outer membrane protein [Aquaticitalea lipolytica]|uniref:SusC/RagA family TonB-linked outer membrane protein n=1 Tax=Aquaticitalea lipolytica TaxID=1247562 RepID=A0A8J2TQJ4_9FLAO|nr:TonB-dependent receptor [Aquaticitalea lipolytica]GFZ87048.1 SusC/RagA family TonB-linked outer membrane protein [Aquaticitalea lipolytica]